MPMVLTECPKSGTLVPTGIEVERREQLAFANVLWECPACSDEHPWTPDDTIFVGGEPGSVAAPG